MRSRMLRRAALLALVVSLLLAQDSAHSRPAEQGTSAPQYTHNRFGRLASEVWRYRAPFKRRDLPPVRNNNPEPEPQPRRDRPGRMALNADASKLYVTLTGTEAEPGHELVVVDVARQRVLRRIGVGSRPYAPFLHPGGRFLIVTNELSNYASIVDTQQDRVIGEIALDYYCQGLTFSRDGQKAFVANRYLDQVFVVDLHASAQRLSGVLRVLGGYDERAFFGDPSPLPETELALRVRQGENASVAKDDAAGTGGINAILRARCGRCHSQAAGGFLAGPDPIQNFFSVIDNSVPGQPDRSVLLRAVLPRSSGGFGDQRKTPQFHAGGALFHEGEPELERLRRFIAEADDGPGISVGNSQAHPKDVALSPDGRHLFVGNTGTMDVAIIDLEREHQVGGIFVGNVTNHLAVVADRTGRGRDNLLIFTMGAGFGGAKSRDPDGAETWDRAHPGAQLSVLRDPATTDPYPPAQQHVLGPYDAVDGTWNFKMRDIQSDIVAVDLSRLHIPAARRGDPLDYQVLAQSYEAHADWVRFTSDSAEATSGDMKGDIPPELQRVPGAFFEWATQQGEDVFTTMAGSFEVVQWRVHAAAADPSQRLEPVRVYPTGLRPVGVAASERQLFVANELGETLSIIDRDSGRHVELPIGALTRPALDTDAEKGELIAHTTVFSSDNDTACIFCHYRDTGDGRGWGAAESVGQDRDGWLTHGGTLGIPQMRNIYAIQPYYFEGTHRLSEGQGADINEPASSVDFDRPIWAGDFTAVDSQVPERERRMRHEELKERVSAHKLGSRGYTLDARRNAFFRQQSLRYFGAAHDIKDLYRFMSSWLGSNNHLLPNPYDPEYPSRKRGEQLFSNASVMCSVCHAAPEFTNKTVELTHNDTRSLPQLTTTTRRDASYTLAGVRAVERANEEPGLDLAPTDRGRVESGEGRFTTMQLRGIFDRPPVFLHHGRARSLREAIATPGHPGLQRFRLPVYMGTEHVRAQRMEQGFNELTRRLPDGRLALADQLIDSHGGTSHLSASQLRDLVDFMQGIP